MPTGTFLGDQLTPDSRAGGSITGPAAPSNPRYFGAAPYEPGGNTMTQAGPRYAGPAGSDASSSGSSVRGGFNQFPMGQGPSATQPGSIAQYPNTIYGTGVNALGSLQSVQNFVNGLYGPQQTLLAQQLARQQDQLGLVGADAAYKTDALNRDAALNRQLLGLDRAQLGLDQGLVNTQLGNLGRLRDILGQRKGIAGESLANQLRSIGISETEAKDMAGRKIFDLRSDLTARGAFNTVANERGTGRINRDLYYELGQLGTKRTDADIQYRNQLLGLNEQGISYDNQQAALQSKLSGIGLDYKRLDISQQQLENGLADGLHNIGMGSMTTINGLLDAMGSTNAQQAALAGEILQQVISYSNLPPNVIAQLNQMLGLGATSNTSGSRNNTTGTSGGTRTGGNYGT